MQRNLITGSVTKSMLLFSVPMILGNLLQQLYNIADTLIVGRYLGSDSLAAVGSSFTLMTFLTSILLGLCMGSGTLFSMYFGAKNEEQLKTSFFVSFVLIGAAAIIIELLALYFMESLLHILHIPVAIREETGSYLRIIFYGIIFTFLFNYFASMLRSIGSSFIPLIFLGISASINICLDLILILVFHMGVKGAAWATVIAQGISAICIMIYCFFQVPAIRLNKQHMHFNKTCVLDIGKYSLLTCIQQSIMNFGILLVQGLINSFGVTVMAAFAAAVKIDSFAYMPVQDFGNAFSTFIAQNHGACEQGRIRKGILSAFITVMLFCSAISIGISIYSKQLMTIFVKSQETEIIAIGAAYLRIEGTFYCGIGCLFLLYGLYRGIGKPGISVILTVISLGTRVLLAYILAPAPTIGLVGIWWAIPIGWLLADMVGLIYYFRNVHSI